MKRMSIKPETLETPERGMSLETREKQPAKARSSAADLRGEIEALRDDLRKISERATEARALPLPERGTYCLDCYRRGLAAAADHIEGKPPKRGNPDSDRP